MKKRKLPLWAVLLWLLVWQAASMALDSDILLVSPLRVIATLLALLPTARFWASLLGSVARILGGFFLAAALGTLLAALAARFKRVEEWLAPPVLAMKTVPVASFVILALIWFGSRNLSVFIALVMGVTAIRYSLSPMASSWSGMRPPASSFMKSWTIFSPLSRCRSFTCRPMTSMSGRPDRTACLALAASSRPSRPTTQAAMGVRPKMVSSAGISCPVRAGRAARSHSTP